MTRLRAATLALVTMHCVSCWQGRGERGATGHDALDAAVSDAPSPDARRTAQDGAQTGSDSAPHGPGVNDDHFFGDLSPTCRATGPAEGEFFAINPTRRIDLLFMIDNSGSMVEEQANLRRNFPAMIKVLSQLPGGLPDLHIGIISSNVGAGNAPLPAVPACNEPGGDRGLLQVKAGCGLQSGSRFIKSYQGGTQNNFAGQLEDVFSCLADLGNAGCGWEHQLQSVRLALSPAFTPANAGFLRADAQLAIIIITDEDDCSAPPDSDLFVDPAFQSYSGSLRCNLVGHVCNGMGIPGTFFDVPLQSCEAREEGRLIPIRDFVESVKALKPASSQIFVSAITGMAPTPQNARYRLREINLNQRMELDVAPICNSPAGSAAPALRLESFVKAFGNNATHESICNDDFTPALRRIGEQLAVRLVAGCIEGQLADSDTQAPGVQAKCLVRERRNNSSTGASEEVTVPACGAGAKKPCWTVKAADEPNNTCGFDRAQVVVEEDGAARDVYRSIKCVTCAP